MGFTLNQVMSATKPEQKGFGIIPEGVYLAYCEEATVKESQASGNKYVQAIWQLKDFEGNNVGRLWDTISIVNEKLLFSAAQLLRAVGLDKMLGPNDEISEENLALAIAKNSVVIHTKVRVQPPYKDKAEVAKFDAMGGYAPIDEANIWYDYYNEGKDPTDALAALKAACAEVDNSTSELVEW